MNKIKIDFVIIGAQKSGTTTIHEILKNHPQIQLPFYKEAFEYLFKPNKLKDCYRLVNQKYKYGLVIPQIMCYPSLLKKIIKNNPDVKLICILRDPFQRMVSALKMYYQWGYITKSIYLNYNFQIPKNFNFLKKRYTLKQIKYDRSIKNIVSWSYYGKILNYIIKKYKIKKKNLIVITFDDLKKNNLKKLFNFLNIKQIKLHRIEKSNISNIDYLNRLMFFCLIIIKKIFFIRILFNILPSKLKFLIVQFRLTHIKRNFLHRNFVFSKKLENSIYKDLQKNYLTKNLKFKLK